MERNPEVVGDNAEDVASRPNRALLSLVEPHVLDEKRTATADFFDKPAVAFIEVARRGN